MHLGQILESAALKNLCEPDKNKKIPYTYFEGIVDGKYTIRLQSVKDRDAYLESELPGTGTEDERNYLRLYFLSMCFNSAIYGQIKIKFKKK
jgi:hypothetical protein